MTEAKFPVNALLPKAETNALNFLKKYPDFDGRDVTIAIFDSGVDPCAAGLKTLPEGSTKVIERFDCTGCGDVDTSKKVVAANAVITGLSGRKLKLSKLMRDTCPSQEYRVGLKSLYDLFPVRVREKMIADFRTNKWDEPHKRTVADILREVDQFESKHSSNTNSILPLEEKLRKENMDALVEVLNSYDKKLSDLKTSLDCIVFQASDNIWTAVIDTTETGDLEKATVLKEYGKTHDIQSINGFLTVTINVHNEGNCLEIVGMCSSHGTHVASIASGYHENEPEINGVAPAAKIVSLTIGDGRLGSMETGTGVIRAIIKVMEMCEAGRQIDVINMSYGEHGHWSNSGRIGELINEVVNKYGVVWVASAGNHGPALCTIGIPPDISKPSCVGVGAYFSADMMEAEYTLRGRFNNVYTWTSRDPCIDGGKGVTVCAPGAAITSVPEFTLTKAQLMNGTSMAAPNVAGSVALLISGLKQQGITYSAFSVKRALENSATPLATVDKFAQGSGLINVEKAYEYLVQTSESPAVNVRFSISTDSAGSKGIHLRTGVLRKPEEFSVAIEPAFLNEKEVDPKLKIAFNLKLVLVPSAEWVKCGTYLDLCYASRNINVRIDPAGLEYGSVNQAVIRAYASNDVGKGHLFEIPITVVQPHPVPATFLYKSENHLYSPNTIIRHFLHVPNYATWAILKLRASDDDTNTFFIHTMQILPARYCNAMETQRILALSSEHETQHPFKCDGNGVLEVCIAKYWSNMGSTTLASSVEFHGIYSVNGNVMHAANGVHRIDLRTLRTEEVNPSISIKNAIQVLKASESKVTPLTSRDVLPKGRQIYQNVLTFNLHLAKQQELSVNVPLLSSVLYESKYESQFWMIFDANKQMVGCGDAYSATNFIKLEKGDYVIRLQVRHEKKEILEKLNDVLTMLISYKLSNTLSPEIFRSFNAASSGGKKCSTFQLSSVAPKPIYVAPLAQEKLTKAGIPAQCSWLEGTITYAKDELGKKVDVSPFQYVLIEGPPVKKANGSSNGKDAAKSKFDEYKENLRDLQSNAIPKLDAANAEEVYRGIVKDHPDFLQVHMSLIQNLDNSSDLKTQLPMTNRNAVLPEKSVDDLKTLCKTMLRIIELSDNIIKNTDLDTLLTYYGLKVDTRADASKIKSNMDKQKTLLIEAYAKKAIALGKLHLLMSMENAKDVGVAEALEAGAVVPKEAINALYLDASKMIEMTDTKAVYICMWHAFINNHWGRLAKSLHKLYEEKLQRDVLEESRYVFKELQWEHMVCIIDKIMVNANPQSYRLF